MVIINPLRLLLEITRTDREDLLADIYENSTLNFSLYSEVQVVFVMG